LGVIRKPQPGNCSLVPCTHGCCTRGVSACCFPSRCAAVQWRGGRASRCECMGNIQYGGVGNSGVGLQQVQACSRYMQLPCFQSLLQQPHWGNTPEMGYVAAPLDPCWVFFCQLGTGAAAFSPDLETKAVPAVGHCRMVLSCDPGLSHGSTPGRRAAGPRCPEHSFLAPSIIPRRLHPIEMAMTCCAIPARRLPWTPACLLEETLGKSRAMGLKVFRVLRNSLQHPLSPSTGTAPSFHVTVPCLPGVGCTGSVPLCSKAPALLLPPLPFALQCLTHVQVGPHGGRRFLTSINKPQQQTSAPTARAASHQGICPLCRDLPKNNF